MWLWLHCVCVADPESSEAETFLIPNRLAKPYMPCASSVRRLHHVSSSGTPVNPKKEWTVQHQFPSGQHRGLITSLLLISQHRNSLAGKAEAHFTTLGHYQDLGFLPFSLLPLHTQCTSCSAHRQGRWQLKLLPAAVPISQDPGAANAPMLSLMLALGCNSRLPWELHLH